MRQVAIIKQLTIVSIPSKAALTRLSTLLFWLLSLLVIYSDAQAVQVTVFGPTNYTRQMGAPVQQNATFSVTNLNGDYTLTVYNGGLVNNTAIGELVSSSEIKLNGVVVIGPSNFNQQTPKISVPVSLLSSNQLSVELRGKPGGSITVEITGEVKGAVADAGSDANALLQNTFGLDGSGSYDPDQKLLNYSWTITNAPAGSQAILIGANLPNPSFTPDLPGDYVFSLVVNNGTADSPADEVIIKAFQDIAPPNANAGADKNVLLGQEVTLDGSLSSDPNAIGLSYLWSFSTLPPASTLTSSDLLFLNTPNPKFTPDVIGTFDINLQASNGSLTDTDSVRVNVAQTSTAPNAEAGEDFSAKGDITLDGSGSNDPDNSPSPLGYKWDFVALPQGSQLTSASIQNRLTANASFTPDKEGAYVLRLTVNDGNSSDADNILVVSDNTIPDLQLVVLQSE